MRKAHYKVTLDVFIHSDEDSDIISRLNESDFLLDPDRNALDEVGEVQDITVEDVEVIDSR